MTDIAEHIDVIDGKSLQKMPSDNVVWSIVCTLLFSTILGVISFWFSSRVAIHYMNGDYENAISASKKAKNWAIAGIALSVVVGIFMMWAVLFVLKEGGEFNYKIMGTEV